MDKICLQLTGCTRGIEVDETNILQTNGKNGGVGNFQLTLTVALKGHWTSITFILFYLIL